MYNSYEEIKVLSQIEHVRTRPEMYIGNTNNPSQLFYEVIDNSLDEAFQTSSCSIRCRIEKNYFSVEDNGRGFPLKDNQGEDAIITACTKLFSGGKFDKKAYSSSIGLHGVGLVAVNALSEKMNITSKRRNISARSHNFSRGILQKEKNNSTLKNTGTYVESYPDSAIFKETSINIKNVEYRLRLASTLIDKVKIYLNKSLLKPFEKEELLFKSFDTNIIEVEVSDSSNQSLRVILAYDTKEIDKISRGSVNLLEVNEGTHINISKTALSEAWMQHVGKRRVLKEDTLCGLRIFVSGKIANPAYSSQTKENLSIRTSELKELKNKLTNAFEEKLKENEELRSILIRKFEEYRKFLDRHSTGNYLNSVLAYGEGTNIDRGSSGISKLLDCRKKSRKGTELFVVEGDSAAGCMIPVKDDEIHAILPLRGKVLNVINKPINSILDNQEIRSLINGIGAGAFFKQKINSIRYEKIIVLTDGDVDGQNILALLIGCLCYIVPEIVKQGSVFVARAPLYGYRVKNEFIPVFDKEKHSGRRLKRFKGLGKMNEDEIKQVAFNNKTRKLIRVTLNEDSINDISKIVGTSGGKREVLEKANLIL